MRFVPVMIAAASRRPTNVAQNKPDAAQPAPAPPVTSTPTGYHGAVSEFKKRLIETTLHQVNGNRTHAARALGLQRTYLLRLIRELAVSAPPSPPRRTGAGAPPHVRSAG